MSTFLRHFNLLLVLSLQQTTSYAIQGVVIMSPKPTIETTIEGSISFLCFCNEDQEIRLILEPSIGYPQEISAFGIISSNLLPRYSLSVYSNQTTHIFNFTINPVTQSDIGVFTCSALDNSQNKDSIEVVLISGDYSSNKEFATGSSDYVVGKLTTLNSRSISTAPSYVTNDPKGISTYFIVVCVGTGFLVGFFIYSIVVCCNRCHIKCLQTEKSSIENNNIDSQYKPRECYQNNVCIEEENQFKAQMLQQSDEKNNLIVYEKPLVPMNATNQDKIYQQILQIYEDIPEDQSQLPCNNYEKSVFTENERAYAELNLNNEKSQLDQDEKIYLELHN